MGASQCTCEVCGKTFRPRRNSKGRFCSRACYWQSMRGLKPHNYDPVTVECAICGKQFVIQRNRIGKAKFCSYTCMGVAQAKPMTAKTCPTCGKVFEVWPSHERVRYCSHECHGKDTRAERSPFWQGGRFPYYGGDWKEVRERVRARDGHRCQVCGVHESDLPYRLHVHHIIPRREFNGDLVAANEELNLISLCRRCHRRAEKGSVVLRPRLV